MEQIEIIAASNENQLSHLKAQAQDVIVISTFFDPAIKSLSYSKGNYELTLESRTMINTAVESLKYGGILFVYGIPFDLGIWGDFLSTYRTPDSKLIFKYWITLDIDKRETEGTMMASSQGLLMYIKGDPKKKTQPPFHLNTSAVRVPHRFCTACGENTKDWGGKKHLMNPLGTALSDVWRDLPKSQLSGPKMPEAVLERIVDLTNKPNGRTVHIIQSKTSISVERGESFSAVVESANIGITNSEFVRIEPLELNKVYEGDSIAFMNKVYSLHPEGVFDLVFADPPYNLKKQYGTYADEIADHQYIEWCNEWLMGMVNTLKPGGSLFVLNLPKWSVHHSQFLTRHLDFRHWITWDALSDPRGKIMPAHYSLLYFTKPGRDITFNYSHLGSVDPDAVVSPTSSQYCLRASCVRTRRRLGDDVKVPLSDIWSDVHRIKHKRDRDNHPCQLPDKLMERIIKLSTNKNDVVFDPFCGAGTTALAARRYGRRFVTIDLDPVYVEITKEKLRQADENLDLFGTYRPTRASVSKMKPLGSKKEIEVYLQGLAVRLGKEPSEADILNDNREVLWKIDQIYPSRRDAIKRARVALHVHSDSSIGTSSS